MNLHSGSPPSSEQREKAPRSHDRIKRHKELYKVLDGVVCKGERKKNGIVRIPRQPQIRVAEEEHSFCFGWRSNTSTGQTRTANKQNTHTRGEAPQRLPQREASLAYRIAAYCRHIPMCRVQDSSSGTHSPTHRITGLDDENSGVHALSRGCTCIAQTKTTRPVIPPVAHQRPVEDRSAPYARKAAAPAGRCTNHLTLPTATGDGHHSTNPAAGFARYPLAGNKPGGHRSDGVFTRLGRASRAARGPGDELLAVALRWFRRWVAVQFGACPGGPSACCGRAGRRSGGGRTWMPRAPENPAVSGRGGAVVRAGVWSVRCSVTRRGPGRLGGWCAANLWSVMCCVLRLLVPL